MGDHFHCSCFSTFRFVYVVMKCLLEAHDSNPARFDRECLIHLSSRLKMWELAAKVGISLFTVCGFNPFEESLMVKANFTMLKNVVKGEMSI